MLYSQMRNRQNKLQEVFLDTEKRCEKTRTLFYAVKESRENTKLYRHGEELDVNRKMNHAGIVSVSTDTTFDAARIRHAQYPDKKIAVLNFASATNPGGGVLSGAVAQEESLCRCSTLYKSLDQEWLWNDFYSVNQRTINPFHTNDCIYSPNVIIFKSDEDIPQLLPESLWTTVDVISCSAPNLRQALDSRDGAKRQINQERLKELHFKRGKHIIMCAAANDVDVLILGAFGCGVFQNDPTIVANAYKYLMLSYAKYFEQVEFAIYSHGHDNSNYEAFKRAMDFSM